MSGGLFAFWRGTSADRLPTGRLVGSRRRLAPSIVFWMVTLCLATSASTSKFCASLDSSLTCAEEAGDRRKGKGAGERRRASGGERAAVGGGGRMERGASLMPRVEAGWVSAAAAPSISERAAERTAEAAATKRHASGGPPPGRLLTARGGPPRLPAPG